jgi:hypothetical protein
MFIEYLPPSPKAGIKEHQSRETAAALIAAGFAQPVPLTDSEKLEIAKNSGHTIVPHYSVPVWSVGAPYGALLVVRRFGTETTYFKVPPDRKQWPDCPESISEEFERQRAKGVLLAQ